jgi:hypothetical protein
MSNSFEVTHAGLAQRAIPSNSSRVALFLENDRFQGRNFRQFSRMPEPVASAAVSYRGTRWRAKMRLLDSIFPPASHGEIQ